MPNNSKASKLTEASLFADSSGSAGVWVAQTPTCIVDLPKWQFLCRQRLQQQTDHFTNCACTRGTCVINVALGKVGQIMIFPPLNHYQQTNAMCVLDLCTCKNKNMSKKCKRGLCVGGGVYGWDSTVTVHFPSRSYDYSKLYYSKFLCLSYAYYHNIMFIDFLSFSRGSLSIAWVAWRRESQSDLTNSSGDWTGTG